MRNQNPCGTCVSFGVTALLESAVRIVEKWPENKAGSPYPILAPAYLHFCLAGKKCDVGWVHELCLDKCKNPGVTKESLCPYGTAVSKNACSKLSGADNRLTRISGYKKLTTVNDMLKWLQNRGPLVTRFDVYGDFYGYKSGVYKRTPNAKKDGGHCILCIGFDSKLQAWLCKNSWGTGWGKSGYFWIGYGQCGINASMCGVEGFSRIERTK